MKKTIALLLSLILLLVSVCSCTGRQAKNDGYKLYRSSPVGIEIEYPDFWEMIGEMKPPVTMGIDAHSPDAYLDYELYENGIRKLRSLGLELEPKIKMLSDLGFEY